MANNIFQRLKDGLDATMRAIGYFPQESVFALHQQHVAIADRDRITKESLSDELIHNDARIGDLKAVLDETADLMAQNDLPEAMLRYMIIKQDRIIESLVVEAERRAKARQRVRLLPRDAAGRFLPAPKDTF